jgi:hypothetical protein
MLSCESCLLGKMRTKWPLPPPPSILLLALIVSCAFCNAIEFVGFGLVQLLQNSNLVRVGCG